MKKWIMSLVLLLILAACGGSSESLSFNASELLSEEETRAVLRDPKDNKGKSLEFAGLLFNIIDEEEDYIYAQVYLDFENFTNDIALKIPKSLGLNITTDTFVLGQGFIIGELSGENLLGGKVSMAAVEVDNMVMGSFQDTVAKPIKTVDLNLKQEQHGHVVILEKIEFSNYDTRLYVKAENHSQDKVSMYSFDIAMIINGKNYTEEYSFYGNYGDLDFELAPNTYTEAIIPFKVLNIDEVSTIKVIIDSPYSDNWDIEFQDYVFEFDVN